MSCSSASLFARRTAQSRTTSRLLLSTMIRAAAASVWLTFAASQRHKVKLNPGTTKKGQAVKTALEIFSRDKATTPNERDLIKLLKVSGLVPLRAGFDWLISCPLVASQGPGSFAQLARKSQSLRAQSHAHQEEVETSAYKRFQNSIV